MNLRDVVRRNDIIIKRREEKAKLELAIKEAKEREERAMKAAEQRRKERQRMRDTETEYDMYCDSGVIDKYAQMLMDPNDDYEMRDMKMQAIMAVMKEFRY